MSFSFLLVHGCCSWCSLGYHGCRPSYLPMPLYNYTVRLDLAIGLDCTQEDGTVTGGFLVARVSNARCTPPL